MHQQISRKILIYLFIFIILTSINNFKYLDLKLFKIDQINISGLNNLENINIYNDIKDYKKRNIFFLNNFNFSKKIYSNELVQKFEIFKKYPSTLDVNLTKTNFLGITKIDGIDYIIGSNGKFIKKNNTLIDLPFVFGKIKIDDFLILKEILNKSNFELGEIDSFYYFKSNRWDIKTKKGLIIRLPSQLDPNVLNKINQIINDVAFRNIKTIDLRQNNQIITYE
jgi:cell division septal protein FtsQ